MYLRIYNNIHTRDSLHTQAGVGIVFSPGPDDGLYVKFIATHGAAVSVCVCVCVCVCVL